MKYFRMLAAVLGLLAMSCAEEFVPDTEVGSQDETDKVTITASYASEGSETKTAMDQDYELVWSAGDAFVATSSSAVSVVFTINNADDGKASASFTGERIAGLDGAAAFYPSDAFTSRSSASVNFNLPAQQSYSASGFASGANPMLGVVADAGDGSYRALFSNVCGLLMLQLTGEDIVYSIELTDNSNAALCGSASVAIVSLDDVLAGKGPAAKVSASGGKSITLDCGDSGVQLGKAALPFCFVVPEGSFKIGFTAKLVTSAGEATLSTSKDQTITRSRIRRMAVCNVAPDPLSITEEFNIENPCAVQFLAANKNTFDSSIDANFNSAVSLRANSLNNGYRPDQPNSKKISFATNGATELDIVLATDANLTDVVLHKTISVSGSSANYSFTNLVPGKEYYYKVRGNNKVLAAGGFKATGQLRMIKIDRSWNIRDLGGWTGWNGNKVRYEQIYRGGSPGGRSYSLKVDNSVYYYLSDYEYEELHRIGIRAQLDLRDTYDKKSESTDYVNAYTLGETRMHEADFENVATNNAIAKSFENPAFIGDVAFVIKELKAGKPVYFHCRIGSDRTGATAMLLLGLLGCGDKTTSAGGNPVVVDYELSSLRLSENETISYNSESTPNIKWYDRKMSSALKSSNYDFYKNMWNMSVSSNKLGGASLNTLQDKIYYYLNRYFVDNTTGVNGSNKMSISKSDLDWFINYMLDTQSYVGPSWAQDGSSPSLEDNISMAKKYMYTTK